MTQEKLTRVIEQLKSIQKDLQTLERKGSQAITELEVAIQAGLKDLERLLLQSPPPRKKN